MKKTTLTNLLVLFTIWHFSAQNIILSQFPKNNQLIPRNVSTNKGTYTLSGYVTHNLADTLVVTVFREALQVSTWTFPIQLKDGRFNFTHTIEIKAELANYSVELNIFNKGTLLFSKKADRIVAGDVFIVNGQSNSNGSLDFIDYDPFMRSYTNEKGWTEIQHTQPSRWCPRMAKRIIQNYKIPVAIINEAYGGERLYFFLKNNNPTSNYNALINRLSEAEIYENVRGICWWQGESDGWETPLDTFKKQFKQLYADWQRDYKVPVFYFQVRFRSCGHKVPGIMETQRQILKELPNAEIISPNAAMQNDSCHFYYNNGYDSLGSRLYRLVAAKLYNASSTNVRSPDVEKAWFSKTNEITIKMKNVVGSLKIIGKPWNDFVLNGVETPITTGKITDDKIILSFQADSATVKKITGVSYISHVTQNEDWIVNPLGLGILSFYNVPISDTATNVNDTSQEINKMTIYPTINEGLLYFTLKNKTKQIEYVNIYTLDGRKILQHTIPFDQQEGTIDVHNLAKGIYIVRYTEGGAVVKFLKI